MKRFKQFLLEYNPKARTPEDPSDPFNVKSLTNTQPTPTVADAPDPSKRIENPKPAMPIRNDDGSLPPSEVQAQATTTAPKRSDYDTSPQGEEAWKRDTQEFSRREGVRAEQQTKSASGTVQAAETATSILKPVGAVANTTLSVAASTGNPIAMGLNAGVKAIEGGIDFAQGNNLSAGLNAVDAVLPYAGEMTSGLKIAKTAGDLVKNPLVKGAEMVAEKIPGVKAGMEAVRGAAFTGAQAVGAAPKAALVVANTAPKVALKTGVGTVVSAGQQADQALGKPIEAAADATADAAKAFMAPEEPASEEEKNDAYKAAEERYNRQNY